MSSFIKPEVILTHESDLDGLLSGLLLKQLASQQFDDDVPLESYHNYNWKQRVLTERCAWVADLTFESRLDRPNWLVIDHHETNCHPRHARLIHDVSKSASLLCYELCKEHGMGNERLDRLVHLSNVADLFLEDDPDFILANDYASLVKNYSFQGLYELIDGDIQQLLDHPLLEVVAVKRTVEDPIGLRWSRRQVEEITPEVGFVPTVVGNTNMIVHQLLRDPTVDYSVLITVFRKANGAMVASLRSHDGQALEIARRLQGGGHPNASGATLPRSLHSIPDAVRYLRSTLNPDSIASNALNNIGAVLDSAQA